MIRDHLVRLFAYRAREKKTRRVFPAETVEMLFPCFLKLVPKEIQKAKKNNTSILHEIVTVIAAMGRAAKKLLEMSIVETVLPSVEPVDSRNSNGAELPSQPRDGHHSKRAEIRIEPLDIPG